MSRHPILSLAVLITAVNVVGCGGPRYHEQMRTGAAERVAIFKAQLAYDQATQAFNVGRFEKAYRQILGAIQQNPDTPGYYLLQGRILMETHRLERAIHAFEKAIELEPRFANAHYYSGIVYQRWSDDERAYEHYLRAHELDSSSVQYLLAAAEVLVALQQYDDAMVLVESKLDYYEHNAAMRQLLGQITMLQGDALGAAKQFAEARLLNPDDEMLLDELAHAQYAAGLYGECYKSVKQLQRKSKIDDPALMLLEARCLAGMQRNTEARNLYLKLTRVQSTNPEVWLGLGSLAWELGDFRRTALCGARLIALAPQRYEGYMLKGIFERHNGNIQQATALLREAASLAPSEALPYLVLGRTLEEAGDIQGALGAYTEALKVEPNNADAQALFKSLSLAPAPSDRFEPSTSAEGLQLQEGSIH